MNNKGNTEMLYILLIMDKRKKEFIRKEYWFNDLIYNIFIINFIYFEIFNEKKRSIKKIKEKL